MDDDDANDMMAPDGTLCSDVESFTESWKVPGSCMSFFMHYSWSIYLSLDIYINKTRINVYETSASNRCLSITVAKLPMCS